MHHMIVAFEITLKQEEHDNGPEKKRSMILAADSVYKGSSTYILYYCNHQKERICTDHVGIFPLLITRDRSRLEKAHELIKEKQRLFMNGSSG